MLWGTNMSKLVAVCGWKYESEEMVEDMKKNMSWVDEFCILDCRKRDELWIHEGQYRLILREMARKAKADWLLICSPDERYEDDAGEKIRPLIEGHQDKKIFEFSLKELYHPNWYRIDGIWGEKFRRRMYPLLDDQIMKYQPIQCPSMPVEDGYEVVRADVNIYHLKMIEPENRTLRAKIFKALDPENKYQSMGYDYLDDENGARMQRIPSDRMYHPKYKTYKFEVPKEYLCPKK